MKAPVHVIFYRIGIAAIEVVRVLHERMEPSLHFADRKPKREPRRPARDRPAPKRRRRTVAAR